jgi:hypothetical protein
MGAGVYGEGAIAIRGEGSSVGVWGEGDDTGVYGLGWEGGDFHSTGGNESQVATNNGYKIIGPGVCSFVQNHPSEQDRVIVYACPEGDEVATYTRGSARLTNGQARVQLGETFTWVTNPSIGLTAQITPRGAWADLYVKSVTTEELVVASKDGTGEGMFDYLVYGLRIGFEEMSVVQEKKAEAHIPSMRSHRELYAAHPELRNYNALERFKAMSSTSGQTGALDLSVAHALRDAIEEYDPAKHGDVRGSSWLRGAPGSGAEARPVALSAVTPASRDEKDQEVRDAEERARMLEAEGRIHAGQASVSQPE